MHYLSQNWKSQNNLSKGGAFPVDTYLFQVSNGNTRTMRTMETPEQCVLWKHQNNAYYGNTRTMSTMEALEQCVQWKHQNNAYYGNTRTMRTMETPKHAYYGNTRIMRTMETPEQCVQWKHQNNAYFGNTRTTCKICSNVSLETPARR